MRKKITGRRGPRRGGEIEAGVADLGWAVKKYRETEGTAGVGGIGIGIGNRPQVGELKWYGIQKSEEGADSNVTRIPKKGSGIGKVD